MIEERVHQLDDEITQAWLDHRQIEHLQWADMPMDGIWWAVIDELKESDAT